MFNLDRHFQAALQPLLERARNLPTDARQEWLDDLRIDCPSIAAELQLQLRIAPRLPSQDPGSREPRRVVPGSLESLGLRS